MTEQVPQPSPADPNLSHDDLVDLLRILRTHPQRSMANKRIANKIDNHLRLRRTWIEDARKRNLEAPR